MKIPGRLRQVTSRGREGHESCFPFPPPPSPPLSALRENSRWEASSFPHRLPALGDKTEEVVWGFLGSVLWWPKKSVPSAKFPDFPPNLSCGAINNLMVCHSAGTQWSVGKAWDVTRGSPRPGKWQFAPVTFQMSFTAGYFPFHWGGSRT